MAITTRDFTVSSTGSINNLSGSSTGMPDGMTSSISSDGTTFLLNGDDSQISAIGSGTLTMFANGTDENQNERSANASIQGQIIASYSSITIDIQDMGSNVSLISNSYLTKIEYTDDFRFTNQYDHIYQRELYINNGTTTNSSFYLSSTAYGNDNRTYLMGNEMFSQYQSGSSEGHNDGTDAYGSGSSSTKIGEGSGDFNNTYKITNIDGNQWTDNPIASGTMTFTFAVFTSSFALKMN